MNAPTNDNGLRADDRHSWLETIWGGLHAYREDLIPEGDESYDEIWSDITTAMAWVTEALGEDDDVLLDHADQKYRAQVADDEGNEA